MAGQFVISLDFELLWGVRDHADRAGYGANIMGARTAIPRLLDLFARYGIRATWATVGFLFCEGKEDLLSILPPPAQRPAYFRPELSSYHYLDELGASEAQDPHYFAPSLIRRIADTPGQEIGTHTLSHCYCLEPGMTMAAFDADVRVAQRLAARQGVTLRSIVFPRNQYAAEHLEICRQRGLTAFRGNPAPWAYAATAGAGQTMARRGLRLIDAHTGVLGPLTTSARRDGGMVNIAASRFLRPNAGRLGRLHPWHLRVIKRGMTHAARQGGVFHLWWHPHNFGRNLDGNLNGLAQVITHFRRLADAEGMVSCSIEDLA